MGSGRLPQNLKKVPPFVSKGLKLRDKLVAGDKKDKLAGICLGEMSQLYLCFKNHKFNQEACAKEIGLFQSCYNQHLKNYYNPSESSAGRKMTVSNTNMLLKRFPQRNSYDF